MTTLVDCDKLCTYNAMSTAVTKKLKQRDRLKNTPDKSKWNNKNV